MVDLIHYCLQQVALSTWQDPLVTQMWTVVSWGRYSGPLSNFKWCWDFCRFGSVRRVGRERVVIPVSASQCSPFQAVTRCQELAWNLLSAEAVREIRSLWVPLSTWNESISEPAHQLEAWGSQSSRTNLFYKLKSSYSNKLPLFHTAIDLKHLHKVAVEKSSMLETLK